MKKAWCILCVAMTLGLVGVGCSTGGMKDERILRKYSQDAVVLESRSPEEILAATQVSIQQAYKDELVLYAPKHLAAAENAFDKARTLLASREHVKAMQEGIYAEKVLQAAYVVKKKVARVLSRTLEVKHRLEELGVKGLFPEQYGKLALQIRSAIEAIEDGDMQKGIEAEADLLEPMSRLEVELVKAVRLANAREALARAEAEGAERVAPKSWAESQSAMTRALLYIEKYPRNDVETLARGEEACHAALHALFMSREAKAIAALGEKEFWEEIALELEAHLSRISVSLGAGNLKYMSLRDQAKAISEKAIEQQQALAAMARAAESVAAEGEGQVAVPVTLDAPPEQSGAVQVSEGPNVSAGQSLAAPVRAPQVSMQPGAETVAQGKSAVQPKAAGSPVDSGAGQVMVPVVHEAAPKPSGTSLTSEAPVMDGTPKGPAPVIVPLVSGQGDAQTAPQEKNALEIEAAVAPVAPADDRVDAPVASDDVQQATGIAPAGEAVSVDGDQEPAAQNSVPQLGGEKAVKATSSGQVEAGDGGPTEEVVVKADKLDTEGLEQSEGANDHVQSQSLSPTVETDHADTPQDVVEAGEVPSSSQHIKPDETDEPVAGEVVEGLADPVSE